jgi:2-dehydro-3-deoxy-D-arabinonate dehydratase
MYIERYENALSVQEDGKFYLLPSALWDQVFLNENPLAWLKAQLEVVMPLSAPPLSRLLPPIGPGQEVWAAGVTYMRSKEARMEEAKASGGSYFYDKVYEAARPELFFKALPHRVTPNQGKIRVRKDAGWTVPEPELTLAINAHGTIIGYTIGNDVSSRDIEGENPLYLPQAKVYEGSTAIGPGILLTEGPLPGSTTVSLTISREGSPAFQGEVSIDRIKRKLEDLVAYLFAELDFPQGCLLMTGTGIVPPDDFTLQSGDEVRIAISGLGILVNTVA